MNLLVWSWTSIVATVVAASDAAATAARILAADTLQHPAAFATTALVKTPRRPIPTATTTSSYYTSASCSPASRPPRRSPAPGGRSGSNRVARAGGAAPCTAERSWKDLHGEDAVGRFLRATAFSARSAEDGVADEDERAARLLEARFEEAAAAVRAAEEETSFLLDELSELRTVADKIMPEMNHEVKEENERSRRHWRQRQKRSGRRWRRLRSCKIWRSLSEYRAFT